MSARRHVIHRGLRFERWGLHVWIRHYHGLGRPRFTFEFRLGVFAPQPQPEWITYESDVSEVIYAPGEMTLQAITDATATEFPAVKHVRPHLEPE